MAFHDSIFNEKSMGKVRKTKTNPIARQENSCIFSRMTPFSFCTVRVSLGVLQGLYKATLYSTQSNRKVLLQHRQNLQG